MKDLIQPLWTPFDKAVVSADMMKLTGTDAVYKNSRYTVFVRLGDPEVSPRIVHLSIKRNDQEPIKDWRDLQRIKNELLGPEWEACELYPAESRLVDVANQTHMWCFEPPFKFPFGFTARCVAQVSSGGAKQRPFEEVPGDVEEGRRFLDQQAQIAGFDTVDQLSIHLRRQSEDTK